MMLGFTTGGRNELSKQIGRSIIMKYRICWKEKETGYSSKSEAVLEEKESQQIVDDLNQEWPELEHWVEPGDEVEQ